MSSLVKGAEATILRLADAAANTGAAHERLMVTEALEEVVERQKAVVAWGEALEAARSRLQREVWSGHEVLGAVRKAMASCAHDADTLGGVSSDNPGKTESTVAEDLVKKEEGRLKAWERALSGALEKAWRTYTSSRRVSKEKAVEAMAIAARLSASRPVADGSLAAGGRAPGGRMPAEGGAFAALVGSGRKGGVG